MPRIDVTLQELRARIDRRKLAAGDWAVVGGLVDSRIARTEAQIARLRAKLDRQRQGAAAKRPDEHPPAGSAKVTNASTSDEAGGPHRR